MKLRRNNGTLELGPWEQAPGKTVKPWVLENMSPLQVYRTVMAGVSFFQFPKREESMRTVWEKEGTSQLMYRNARVAIKLPLFLIEKGRAAPFMREMEAKSRYIVIAEEPHRTGASAKNQTKRQTEQPRSQRPESV